MRYLITICFLTCIVLLSGCIETPKEELPPEIVIFQSELEKNLSCHINSTDDTLYITGYVMKLNWSDYLIKLQNQHYYDFIDFKGYDSENHIATFNSSDWDPKSGEIYEVLMVHDAEVRVYWRKEVIAK